MKGNQIFMSSYHISFSPPVFSGRRWYLPFIDEKNKTKLKTEAQIGRLIAGQK